MPEDFDGKASGRLGYMDRESGPALKQLFIVSSGMTGSWREGLQQNCGRIVQEMARCNLLSRPRLLVI